MVIECIQPHSPSIPKGTRAGLYFLGKWLISQQIARVSAGYSQKDIPKIERAVAEASPLKPKNQPRTNIGDGVTAEDQRVELNDESLFRVTALLAGGKI